jgi:drug/metabolite transporter (DMT)-like permease
MPDSLKAPGRRSLDRTGLFHLLVVYIVWGSTYLAIRVAVRPGSGYTPFMVGVTRALIAGGILLAFGAITRQRMSITRRELIILVSLGLLFWVGGNGLVMVGEQRADSGVAALIIAGVPIWAEVIQSILDRKLPSLLLVGSLLLGLCGIAVLTMPLIQTGMKADLLAVAALIVGSISWSGGTVLSSRSKITLSPEVNSGYQLFFGGLGFLAAALFAHEPIPNPTPAAALAVAYLIVFGSLLAFTSFIKALKLLPTNIVTTYGYVNPVIAVFLGWLILSETVSQWTILGAALVLIAVTGVFRDHARKERERAARETTVVSEPVE